MINRKGISLVILLVTLIILSILTLVVVDTFVGNNNEPVNETKETVIDYNTTMVENAIRLELSKLKIQKEREDIYELTNEEIEAVVSKYGTLRKEGKKYILTLNNGKEIVLKGIFSE